MYTHVYTFSGFYRCTTLIRNENYVLGNEGALTEWNVLQSKVYGLIAILIETGIQ